MVGRLGGFATGTGGKKGEKQFGPADTQMPFEKGQEMAVAGINAVLNEPHGDNVLVCNGFSAARPARAEGYALLEVSLPYQLFASRMSSLLLDLKPSLTGLSQEKLAAFALTHVRDWLTLADIAPEEQQISVQARPLDDDPTSLQLAVTVTPPPRILPGGVPVVLGLPREVAAELRIGRPRLASGLCARRKATAKTQRGAEDAEKLRSRSASTCLSEREAQASAAPRRPSVLDAPI